MAAGTFGGAGGRPIRGVPFWVGNIGPATTGAECPRDPSDSVCESELSDVFDILGTGVDSGVDAVVKSSNVDISCSKLKFCRNAVIQT